MMYRPAWIEAAQCGRLFFVVEHNNLAAKTHNNLALTILNNLAIVIHNNLAMKEVLQWQQLRHNAGLQML